MDVDKGELSGGRDSGLSPVTRFEDDLQDFIDKRDINEKDLIDLGLSPSDAHTFVEKFKKFHVKKNKGQKGSALEKELLDLAKQLLKIKQVPLKGSGTNNELSATGARDADIRKDKADKLIDAEMRKMPPEYREMVEEYFKSISSGDKK